MLDRCSRRMIGCPHRHPAALLSIMAGFASLWCSSAHAIPPRMVSDEELARSPTIVIAKWDKAPLVLHNHVEGNVIKGQEARTKIVVTRVIKGTLKPGKCTILLGPAIGWERQDGGNVWSYTTSMMIGDVSDVKDENLWFLESRRSWDTNDKAIYAVALFCRECSASVA